MAGFRGKEQKQIPMTVVLSGDKQSAKGLVPFALKQLRIVNKSLTRMGRKQGTRSVELSNGARVSVTQTFGQATAELFFPVLVEITTEQGVKILGPFIFGISDDRYYVSNGQSATLETFLSYGCFPVVNTTDEVLSLLFPLNGRTSYFVTSLSRFYSLHYGQIARGTGGSGGVLFAAARMVTGVVTTDPDPAFDLLTDSFFPVASSESLKIPGIFYYKGAAVNTGLSGYITGAQIVDHSTEGRLLVLICAELVGGSYTEKLYKCTFVAGVVGAATLLGTLGSTTVTSYSNETGVYTSWSVNKAGTIFVGYGSIGSPSYMRGKLTINHTDWSYTLDPGGATAWYYWTVFDEIEVQTVNQTTQTVETGDSLWPDHFIPENTTNSGSDVLFGIITLAYSYTEHLLVTGSETIESVVYYSAEYSIEAHTFFHDLIHSNGRFVYVTISLPAYSTTIAGATEGELITWYDAARTYPRIATVKFWLDTQVVLHEFTVVYADILLNFSSADARTFYTALQSAEIVSDNNGNCLVRLAGKLYYNGIQMQGTITGLEALTVDHNVGRLGLI